MQCLSRSKPVKKTLLKRWQAHLIWFILHLYLGQPEKCFPGSQKNIFSQEFIFGQPEKNFSQEFIFGAVRKTFSWQQAGSSYLFILHLFLGQPEKCH
jgi:hypothetical protein